MWMDGEEGLPSMLPKRIALPWVAVSDYLGRKPVITYTAGVLCNYSLLNPAELKLATCMLFKRLLERVTSHGLLKFTWLLKLLLYQASRQWQVFFDTWKLVNMKQSVIVHERCRLISECMKDITARMYENCDPKTFFVKIRPFYTFPNRGIVYEGVDTTPSGGGGLSQRKPLSSEISYSGREIAIERYS